MTADKIRPYFLLAMLLGACTLTFFVFQPFLVPLTLAAVFAVVLHPVFRFFLRPLGKKRGTAALLTVLFSIIAILTPLFFIGYLVFTQAVQLYASLIDGSGRVFFNNLVDRAITLLSPYIPGVRTIKTTFAADIESYVTQGLSVVISHLGGILSSVTGLLLALFIFFIALYYLLKDGTALKRFVVVLSPLADTDDEMVFKRLEQSVNSVIKGNLSIAFIQAVVSGLGFAIFGLPNPVLWALVTFFAAMIPGVGTSLVLVPAIVFLFITGSTTSAIGLTIWGMFAVGLIDNFLGPKLMGRGIRLHPLLILLSVLGGLAFFGPIGLFLGPLTLSLLFTLLSIYSESSKTIS